MLTELRDGGHDWYENNTVDGLGDIFLMYSLYLFAQLWCENVALLVDKSSSAFALRVRSDLNIVEKCYKYVAIGTIPLALLFSNAGILHHYDQVVVLYVSWGLFTGLLVLTPVSMLMHRVIESLKTETTSSNRKLFLQLRTLARINLIEQLCWDALIVLALVSFMMFFKGGNRSSGTF